MATELTQRQWVLVMGKNPSHFKKEKHCPDTHAVLDGQALCPNHPVENVSWSDAQNFVDALNSAFGPSSCSGESERPGRLFSPADGSGVGARRPSGERNRLPFRRRPRGLGGLRLV